MEIIEKTSFDLSTIPSGAKEELLSITTKIEELETQLKEYKILQDKYDDFRKQLETVMSEHSISKFISNGGIQFTMVAASETKTELVLEFDVETLKKENPEIYKKYLTQKEKIINGKKGYLRITLPKEREE